MIYLCIFDIFFHDQFLATYFHTSSQMMTTAARHQTVLKLIHTCKIVKKCSRALRKCFTYNAISTSAGSETGNYIRNSV